jgi:uncharacterized RDD family membrane protein YckC
MTDATQDRAEPWGLPSPDQHPEFYAEIPAKRLIAFVVDTVLIGLITLAIVPFTAFTAIFYLPFLMLIVSLTYRTLTLAGGSATLGMRLAAIEMRTHRGERFDLATAAVHTVIYSVAFSMVLPQVISIVLMLTTARRQGLPDLALGTAALNRAARR